jgi:hypothetical protein
MTKGAIQAANEAKKEQIIHDGQCYEIIMKSDRKRMQKKEKMEKKTNINAGTVRNSNCMDVDLAFFTNAMHSWGIHGNGINTTQTEEKPGKDINKRKGKKKCNTFFTTVSAITVQAEQRIL